VDRVCRVVRWEIRVKSCSAEWRYYDESAEFAQAEAGADRVVWNIDWQLRRERDGDERRVVVVCWLVVVTGGLRVWRQPRLTRSHDWPTTSGDDDVDNDDQLATTTAAYDAGLAKYSDEQWHAGAGLASALYWPAVCYDANTVVGTQAIAGRAAACQLPRRRRRWPQVPRWFDVAVTGESPAERAGAVICDDQSEAQSVAAVCSASSGVAVSVRRVAAWCSDNASCHVAESTASVSCLQSQAAASLVANQLQLLFTQHHH